MSYHHWNRYGRVANLLCVVQIAYKICHRLPRELMSSTMGGPERPQFVMAQWPITLGQTMSYFP